MTIHERLESLSIPEPNSGCLLWFGSTCAGGRYGALTTKVANKKKGYMSHRLSYELWCGPIPKGMHVLHKCDVSLCINPAHLFLGTHRDNMRDMAAKGRAKFLKGGLPRRGTENGRAKLTEAQVRAIRSDGRSGKAIAKEYGISGGSVGAIKKLKAWAHVGSAP